MKIRVQVLWAAVGIGVLSVAALPASADEWNKEIKFSFNQPVEIPGHVLIPGSYDFRLADLTDRNVVQIFRDDQKGREHFVATLFTIPDYRLETSDKPVVKFEERRKANPEAIHSWFYPGERTGWEFVYPKAQRLESAMNRPPAAAPVAPVAAAPAAAPLAQSQPAPQAPAVSEVQQETVMVAEAQHPVAQATAPVSTPAAKPKVVKTAAKRSRLPKTASNLPLSELMGGLMLAAGTVVLRLAPRRG